MDAASRYRAGKPPYAQAGHQSQPSSAAAMSMRQSLEHLGVKTLLAPALIPVVAEAIDWAARLGEAPPRD